MGTRFFTGIYYQAVTPEAAAAFWSIFPPAAEERRIIAFK